MRNSTVGSGARHESAYKTVFGNIKLMAEPGWAEVALSAIVSWQLQGLKSSGGRPGGAIALPAMDRLGYRKTRSCRLSPAPFDV